VIFLPLRPKGRKKTHVRYKYNRDTAGQIARARERERENRERLGERERNKDTFFHGSVLFVLAKEGERESTVFPFSFLFPKVSRVQREDP
jgi:hypothetical protein